jgi:hypothetical protein
MWRAAKMESRKNVGLQKWRAAKIERERATKIEGLVHRFLRGPVFEPKIHNFRFGIQVTADCRWILFAKLAR